MGLLSYLRGTDILESSASAAPSEALLRGVKSLKQVTPFCRFLVELSATRHLRTDTFSSRSCWVPRSGYQGQ